MKSSGWGTWIRTKIDGVRVRCSTVELSPTSRLAKMRQKSVARGVPRARRLMKRGLVAGLWTVNARPAGAPTVQAWMACGVFDLFYGAAEAVPFSGLAGSQL